MTITRYVIDLPDKYIDGLNISRTSDDEITVSSGAARDSSNLVDLVLDEDIILNKQFNGVNGLDIGTSAINTMYAIYIIGDSSRFNSPATIMSLDFNAPLLPAGYNVYRRVGASATGGGSGTWKTWMQYGRGKERTTYYDVAIVALTGGAATTYTAIDLSAAIPHINCIALCRTTFTANSAPNDASFLPFGSLTTSSTVSLGSGVATVPQQDVFQIGAVVDGTAPKILYKVTEATDDLDVLVTGFVDQL